MPKPKTPVVNWANGNKASLSANKSPVHPGSPVRKSLKEAPDYGYQIAVIKIGDGQQYPPMQFTVHRAILTTNAEYFRAALAWPGADGTVELTDDVKSDLFGIFVQWIYTGTVFSQDKDLEARAGVTGDVACDREWHQLIELYIMGDRLIAPKFKDAVIMAMIEKEVESSTMPAAPGLVYRSTSPGSTLRRLIIDFHVFGYRTETLKGKAAEMFEEEPPKEFYQDLVATMVWAGQDIYKRKNTPWVEDATSYLEVKAE